MMMKWVLFYLLNSAWQIPALALCALSFNKILRKSRPLFEHRLWVTCFLLCLLCPVLSLLHTSPELNTKSFSAAQSTISTVQQIAVVRRITIPVVESPGPAIVSRVGRFLLWFYLLSIAFGLLKLTLSLLCTRHLIRTSTPVDLPPPLQRELMKSAQILCVRRPVATYINAALVSPAVVGWPESRLLLPQGFIGIPHEDAAAALGHELAHVRRRDFYLNLGYEILAILAFYHPVLHWVKRRLNATREVVCDDLAATTTSRFAYARSLFRLAAGASRAAGPALYLSLGIFQTTMLEDRIMRLVSTPNPLSRKQRILQTAIVFTGFMTASVFTATFTVEPAFTQALEKNGSSGGDNISPNPLFGRSSSYLHISRDKQNSYAIVSGNADTIRGSGNSGSRFNKVKQKMHGDYIWFTRDRKSYVIEDSELVKQAKEDFWPVHEPSSQQVESSKQPAALAADADMKMNSLIDSALHQGKARLVE